MLDYNKLSAAVAELDEETMATLLKEVMAAGGEEAPVAMAACQDGLDKVGKLYENGEYFVGDLIYAGELMTEAIDILRPALEVAVEDDKATGKVIICTVKDDLHDIGKNLVKAILEVNGFDVIDLGIDVSAGRIIDVAKSENVKIIALSGVLTLALDSMKSIISQLRAELPECRIIIGGAPVSAEACEKTGADEWARAPHKTVQVCKEWSRAQ